MSLRFSILASRRAARSAIPSSTARILRSSRFTNATAPSQVSNPAVFTQLCRQFHASKPLHGLMPESSDPPAREAEDSEPTLVKSEIPIEEYHVLADQFMETLFQRLEKMQEEKSEFDVEFANGVINIDAHGKGSYVINKQPPNKQIWLSSPISGPKRYDWVVTGESMNQKEGAGAGQWVYLRDESTLPGILKKELGVDVETDEI